MHKFEEELDCCFRKDTYVVGWKKNERAQIYEEFFVRGGDNCFLQFPNFENGNCLVHIFEDVFPYQLPLSEEDLEVDADEVYYSNLIKVANKFRKIMMVYDHCLSKLRNIDDIEKRKKSKYFKPKNAIENFVDVGCLDFDFHEIGISDALVENLDKRCKYLAYASKLEWKGIIKFSTMNRFRTIEALDKYVEANDLLAHPEGEKAAAVIAKIGRADERDMDPLIEIRPVENLWEYYHPRIMKSEKALKLADELDEEMQIVYEFAYYADEVFQKLQSAGKGTPQYHALREEYQKSVEICKENGSRIPLIALDETSSRER